MSFSCFRFHPSCISSRSRRARVRKSLRILPFWTVTLHFIRTTQNVERMSLQILIWLWKIFFNNPISIRRSKSISNVQEFSDSSIEQLSARNTASGTSKWLETRFSKRKFRWRLGGLFTESGILGIMEAAGYENCDPVSPFFGEIVDKMCGKSESASETNVLTKCLHLNNNIRERFCTVSWTESELDDLSFQLNKFQKVSAKSSGPYRASNMGTSKCHAFLISLNL